MKAIKVGKMIATNDRQIATEVPDGFVLQNNDFSSSMSRLRSNEGTGIAADGSIQGVNLSDLNSYRTKIGKPKVDINSVDNASIDDFYENNYYKNYNIDSIPDAGTREMLLNFGVNQGSVRTIKSLQEIVGTKADGLIGDKTVKAVNDYISENGASDLHERMLTAVTDRYNEVIKENPKNEKYRKGWMNRVKEMANAYDISDINPFAVKDAEAGEIEEPAISGTLPGGDKAFATEIPDGFVIQTDNVINGLGEDAEFKADDPSIMDKIGRFVSNITGAKDEKQAKASLIYNLAVRNRLPVSVVRENFDVMMKNPLFTGMSKDRATEALLTGGLKGITLGLYGGDQDLDKMYPIDRAVGQVAGGILSYVATANVLGVLGLGRFAAKAGTASMAIHSSLPRFIPAAVQTGSVFGTHAGLQEAFKQFNNKEFNPIELGKKSMLNFFTGASLGVAGRTMGYFRRVGLAAGIGTVSAKIEGSTNTEALLQGSIWGGFEAVGGVGKDMRLKEQAVNNVRDNLAKFAKEKMPGWSKEKANAAATAYISKHANKIGGIKKVMEENPIQFFEKLNKAVKETITNWKGIKNVNALEVKVPKASPKTSGKGEVFASYEDIQYKEIIEQNGAMFEGIQMNAKDEPALVMFTDMKTGSTLALKPEGFTDEAVKEKLSATQKAFEASKPKPQDFATAEEYVASKIESDVFYVKIGDNNVEVLKNPTSKDVSQINKEFRKEFPKSKGEPSTRTTVDDNGNEYVWRSDKMSHDDMEMLLSKKYGKDKELFSQNNNKAKPKLTKEWEDAQGKGGELLADYGDIDQAGRVEVSKPPFVSDSKVKRLEKAQKKLETQEKLTDIPVGEGAINAVKKHSATLGKRNYDTNKFINDIEQMLTKDQRETIPFIIEGKGIPKVLEGTEIERIYNDEIKELKPVADVIKTHLNKGWEDYKKAIDSIPNQDIENYVTHIWDMRGKNNKKMADVVSWFTTKNRFSKQRFIESYREGMDKFDLKPKTLDIAEIIRIHDSAVNRSIANKQFVDDIFSLEKEGVKLVERVDKAPRDWVYIDHPELRRTMAMPGELKRGEKVSEEMKGLLHEMGVIIGRRINPVAFGKPVKKAGQFKPGKKPEINLQRMFTTKTLAHEIGHFLDQKLGITGLGDVGSFKKESEVFNKFRQELYEVNKDRINKLKGKMPASWNKGGIEYAETPEEQIAEYFGLLFTDPQKATEIAPKMTDFIMEKFNNDEILKKLTNFDFATKAKNLIEEQLTTLVKLPVKVHPDLAKPLEAVLGGRFQHPVIGAYEALSGVLKKTALSLSLFHHTALTETAIATLGLGNTLKIAFNFKAMYKAIAKGEYAVYKDEKAAKDWIDAGLEFGATSDIPVNKIQTNLNDLARNTKDMPFLGKAVELLSTGNEVWDKGLWNYYHDTLKLYGSEALFAEYYDPNLSAKMQREEIAQLVNDTFGGQNWQRLLVSPKTLQIASWALLSPDWTFSTIRQAMSPTGAGKIYDETKKIRAKIGQIFWLKAALYFGVGINLLNMTARKMDEKKNPERYTHRDKMKFADYTMFGNAIGHKTHLFIGRYKDGTERYIRWGKQFREFPELIFDDTGFSPLTAVKKKIGGKANPNLQLLAQVFTGSSLSGFKNRDIADKKGWDQVWGITKTIFKTPFPFSTRTMFDPNKEFHVSDLAVPSSKGMSRYKAVELFKASYERKDEQFFREIYSDVLDNNLPAPVLASAALTSLKAENTREINSHIKTVEDIDEALKTATTKEQVVLYNHKSRMIKEKVQLEHGADLLDSIIQKLESEGIFEGS